MWGFPYLTWLSIAGMIGILVAMAFIPEQRKPLWLGVVSLGVLLVAYGLFVRGRRVRGSEISEAEPAARSVT